MDKREKRVSKRKPATAKQRRSRRTAEKTRKPEELVYTQPEAFNRRRFILRLLTVAAIVFALLLGMAIFFKVDVNKLTVSGNEKYSAYDILQASGIQNGENLLTLNKARAAGKIKQALPYVDTVRIAIKLPDIVRIEIQELDVVYSIEADDGSWWRISYEGKIVEKTTAAQAGECTKILGVKVTKPVVGAAAVGANITQPAGENETKPETVLGSERLSVAVEILKNLEKNGIYGEITTISVADLSQIEMWYGNQRYQLLLGDSKKLDVKITSLKRAIDQSAANQTGIFSFTEELKVRFQNFS